MLPLRPPPWNSVPNRARLRPGRGGVVRKTRRIYLVGQTRVHLDQVEGLGDFVELEVVLRPGQPAEEGTKIAEDLMRRLGIAEEDLVEGAYFDLIQKEIPSLHQ